MGRVMENLSGMRFGRLVVIQRADRSNGVYWLCRCDCGKETIVIAQSLKEGKTRSCGCLLRDSARKRNNNLNGVRFGRLTAMEQLPELRDGDTLWKCLCDCGNYTNVSRHNLVTGHTKSCGCWRDEKASAMAKSTLGIVDGTSISRISSTRLPSTNTSGVRNVHWDKSVEKWLAAINFRGKHYYLGRYDDIEDARKAVEAARARLHVPFLAGREIDGLNDK